MDSDTAMIVSDTNVREVRLEHERGAMGVIVGGVN